MVQQQLRQVLAGKLYYTYGTDPETGLPIAGQTADITGQLGATGIASALATALNGDTGAYVATATGGTILITAQVSGTINIDRSPLPHAFNTLNIVAGSPSTTLLLAGAGADVVKSAQAASNTLAIASDYFILNTASVAKSGVRVTVKNSSTTVALPNMDVTIAASETFEGNSSGVGAVAENLTTSMIISSATNSSTLDYVSTFAQVESSVAVASTAGTTDRTGWLAD